MVQTFNHLSIRKDVKDGKDEDLTQEPEMIKAFRDTWELRNTLSILKLILRPID